MADERSRRPRGRSRDEIALAWEKVQAVRDVSQRSWIPLTVLALAVLFWAATPMIEAIAGERTVFILSLPILGGTSVVVTINVVGGWKYYRQKQELKELRARCEQLEGRLKAARRSGGKR